MRIDYQEPDAEKTSITPARSIAVIDPFAELRTYAHSDLIGKERAVTEALCDADGKLPIVDLAVMKGVDWDDHIKGFETVQRGLNRKLKPFGWRLIRKNNSACLKALPAS